MFRLLLAFAVVVGSVNSVYANSDSTCPPDKPTKIWGYAKGSDGRALRMMIGFDWHNSNGCKVDEYGKVCVNDAGNPDKPQCHVPASEQSRCCANGGYSKCPVVNSNLDHIGTSNSDISTYHQECLSNKIESYSAEIYPKANRANGGKTNLSRYGGARDSRPITVGSVNEVDFRVPLNYENGGNAGKINGYVRCDGKPAKITRINWWSNSSGLSCGIQGYRSGNRDPYPAYGFYSSNYKDPSTGEEYKVLAGGQCHAESQKYKWVIHVECPEGTPAKKKTFFTNVCKGCGPRVDVDFTSN